MNNDQFTTTIALLILDHETVWFGAAVDEWDAATILACMSEDPASWSEVVLVWSRYQTAQSPEFVDALPLREIGSDDGVAKLDPSSPWMAIDLPRKRIFGGGGYEEIPRDACFGFDEGKVLTGPAIRLSVHLPPWWEIFNEANPNTVLQRRTSPINIPDPRRDVLWGKQLTEGLAKLLCQVACSEPWRRDNCETDTDARHAHTIAVHRDWLMTPRADLDGRTPRECLHGGMNWLDLIIDGQKYGITSERGPVPISREMQTYKNSPMGREEICMYFDCCRELIAFGWDWIVEHRAAVDAGTAKPPLVQVLAELQDTWLHLPYEGGSPPLASIRCERRRVPHIAGEGESHPIDCDCPICDMMADGTFGPTFVGVDGHHLELDDEFAFSLCETREEWEAQQGEYEELSTKLDAEQAERDTKGETDDEFASPWQNAHVNWESMQQGPIANMAISFLLADMITALQENNSPQSDTHQLNDTFRAYRAASPDELEAATVVFQTALEDVARRNEFLIARSADLQSKLDERNRAEQTPFGDDYPG
jgi:hypothetical protein